MIPERAINKAIEGGWKLPTDADAAWWMRWEVIALDRSFWKALGRALGWGEASPIEAFPEAQWFSEATVFVQMVLEGSDMEKEFWSKII